jgi:hypothetical protein
MIPTVRIDWKGLLYLATKYKDSSIGFVLVVVVLAL